MNELRLSDSPVVNSSEDRRALRDAVGRLAGKYGRPYFQEVAKRGGFPEELWRDLGDAGYLGVHLPEEYGGGGGGLADLAVVIEECAAQGCPMQYIVISAICGPILAHHASTLLKDRWLAGIADGTKKMAFAITEPDAGTNTHRISTTATPVEGGGWRLNGAKYWTSGADEADALLVVCRDAEVGPSGKPTLSLLIVDTAAPGLTMQIIDSALGAPERQFMVFFDDVPVAADSIIGAQGQGLKQVFAGLNPERVAAASIANGIALYALQKVVTGEVKGAGEVGEVWIRCGQNLPGYWHQPETTAQALVGEGWLRTGDSAHLDAEGYLFLHDRLKDMIISGGENVYPAEVENVLADHPAVQDVAVIAVPHEHWGETVKAVVVLRAGVVPADGELLAFARTRLARYKCPTSLEYVDTLPRNASGKVLKKDLRARYSVLAP